MLSPCWALDILELEEPSRLADLFVLLLLPVLLCCLAFSCLAF